MKKWLKEAIASVGSYVICIFFSPVLAISVWRTEKKEQHHPDTQWPNESQFPVKGESK